MPYILYEGMGAGPLSLQRQDESLLRKFFMHSPAFT